MILDLAESLLQVACHLVNIFKSSITLGLGKKVSPRSKKSIENHTLRSYAHAYAMHAPSPLIKHSHIHAHLCNNALRKPLIYPTPSPAPYLPSSPTLHSYCNSPHSPSRGLACRPMSSLRRLGNDVELPDWPLRLACNAGYTANPQLLGEHLKTGASPHSRDAKTLLVHPEALAILFQVG